MDAFDIGPPPPPKASLTVRVPAPVLERLKALAKAKRRTVSAVVVTLLEAALDRAEKRS